MRSCSPVEGYRHKCFFNSSLPCPSHVLSKYKRAAPDFSDFLQTRPQFRSGVWCVSATLPGVPLLAREGHICVRCALPRRYNHLVGPWSCRLADSLLDLSRTPLNVLRVLPESNLGGVRWSQIGLSMGEIALIQSHRMLGLWVSRTGVTSSCSYHCGMSCAARRYSPVVLMCWSFVRSMVPATISSVVMISVARIYVARMCVARIYVAWIYVVRVYVVTSIVMISVAQIYVARMCVARIYVAWMCVARIYVTWIYVARIHTDVCRFSSVVVVSVA